MASVKICDGRTVVYQYDTGVSIELCDCRDFTECHFAVNDGIIRRVVEGNICSVPDAALVNAGTLTVYAFSRNDDGGQTQHTFFIHVMARPKPADYIDPPDEADYIDQLYDRLKDEIVGPPGPQGEQGQRGTGYLRILSKPADKVEMVDGKVVAHSLSLNIVKAEANVDEVRVGDCLLYDGAYAYPVVVVDVNVYTSKVIDLHGPAGPQGIEGERGPAGLPGTSVSITSISQSTEDDGYSVVTFSDGKQLRVKNGSKGSAGEGGVGGGSSKYTQPDWGAETGLIEILPEIVLEVNEDTGAAFGMQEAHLTSGDSYTVTYNGADYVCTAFYAEGMPGTSLGNLGVMDEGLPVTEDPFIIMAIDEEFREDYGGAALVVFPVDGSASFTLSIKGEGEIIHKIPGEYVEGGSRYTQPEWGAENGVIVLPETTVSGEDMLPIVQKFDLEIGQEYVVHWNGTEYATACFEVQGVAAIGNIGAATGTGNTGEPFVILRVPDDQVGDDGAYGAAMALDGSTSATLSITGNMMHKIPAEYVEENYPPLIVTVIGDTTGNRLHVDTDFETIAAAIDAGRVVYLSHDKRLYPASEKRALYINFCGSPDAQLASSGYYGFSLYTLNTNGELYRDGITIVDNNIHGQLHVTLENDGTGSYTPDYSSNTINARYRAGAAVTCLLLDGTQQAPIKVWHLVSASETKAIFSSTYISGGNVVVSTVTVEGTNVTVEERTI